MPNKILSQGQQVLEALYGLGRLSGSGIKQGIDTYNEYNPISLLSSLLGKASVIPAEQDLKNSLKGTRTEKAIQSGQQQDPLQPYLSKSAEKALNKKLDMQAEEILQQPDGLNILASVANQGQEQNVKEQNLGQALAGEKYYQEPIEEKSLVPKAELSTSTNPVIKFLEAFISKDARALKREKEMLVNESLRQELEGNKPLQKGEREKINLEFQNKLQEIAATPADALNVEQAGKFANLTTGHEGLKNAANLIAQNQSVIAQSKMPGFLKSQEGRQLIFNMESAFEGQLRAVSGATLGEEEIKRKVKQYGQSLLDSPETIRQKLVQLNNFYETAINTADPTGVHRQRAGGARQDVDGIKNAIAEAKKRGLLQ